MKTIREDNQASIGRFGSLPIYSTFEWQGDLWVKDSSTSAIRWRRGPGHRFDQNTPVLRVEVTVTYHYVDFDRDA